MFNWLKDSTNKLLIVAFSWFVAMNGLDVLSSIPKDPAFHEGNPFMRHLDGSYWLYRGLMVKLLYLSCMLVFSGIIFKAMKKTSRNVAAIAASIVPFYEGWDILSNAVIPNFFIYIHWFTPDLKDLLRGLIGL